MFRYILAALAFAALLPAQPRFEFEGRYWIPQVGSRIRVEQNGFGTDIDARTDLGIPDTNFPEGHVRFNRGWSQVSFSYTPIDLSGDRVVTRSVTFKGNQYTVGTRILSDLSVDHLQLAWTYHLLHLRDGMFRLGPRIEADGFLLHGRLVAPNLSPPLEQKEDLSAGLPTAGLAMEIRPHRAIDLHAHVTGMKVGDYGYFIGSDAGVRVRALKYLLLTAGYRTFNLHVDHTPDFARLRLRGPYIGAGFSF